MRVSTALLADAATVADGKLYVHGGAWDTINTRTVPTTHPMTALAFVIETPWSETHVDRTIRVSLYDEDDQPLEVAAAGILTVGHPPGAVRGAPISQPVALQFPTITFPRAGRYYFKLEIDGDEMARVGFSVRVQPQIPDT